MWNRRKTTSRLSRELEQLRGEFDVIYDRLRQIRPASAADTNSLARLNPWHRQNMAHPVSDAFWGATNAASRGAGQVSHQLEEVFDDAVRAVRQRPLPAGLALLAIGVVVGLMARKVS